MPNLCGYSTEKEVWYNPRFLPNIQTVYYENRGKND